MGQPQSGAGGLRVHRLFSVVRPVSLVAATASRPTGQKGFVTPGRGGDRNPGPPLGPSAITCCPNVPTPTKDLGRGGASSPGQGKEDFPLPSHTARGSLRIVTGGSVVVAKSGVFDG